MHMDAHRRIKVASQIDGFLKRISRINVRGLGLRVWGFRVGGVFILGFFLGGGFVFLVWVRARSLGFRFLEASWFPWLLAFSVSGLLGPSTSCNLVAWSINLAFC